MVARNTTNNIDPIQVGRFWIMPNGRRLPVVAGGDDVTDPQAPVVPEDLSAVSDDAALEALEADLMAWFEQRAEADDRTAAELNALADQIIAVRERREAVAAEAEAEAAEVQAALDRVRAAADPEDGDDEGDDDEGGEDGGDGGAPAGDGSAAREPELVASGGNAAPNRAQRRAVARAVAAGSNRPRVRHAGRHTITAAADVPGFSAGQTLDLSMVAAGMHARARALQDGSPRVGVAHVSIPVQHRILEDMSRSAADEVLRAAADPVGRLDLMDLTAAGGWCTPSENSYELFGFDGIDGLLTLPTVGLSRGGLNVPSYIGLDQAEGALWSWTEDQDAGNAQTISDIDRAGTTVTVVTDAAHPYVVGQLVQITSVTSPALNGVFVVATVPTSTSFTYATPESGTVSGGAGGTVIGQKGCIRIPCPEWTDYRAAMYGLCVEHGNLADAAFPELTRHFVSQVMRAHQIRLGAVRLSQLIASAGTPITMPAGNSDAYGDLMGAIDLRVAAYRSSKGIPNSAILEIALPQEALPLLRANLAKRQGVDLIAVSDQRLAEHFAVRNVRPQFIGYWQTLAGNATAWNANVRFAIWPAGGYVSGTGAQINLGVVRDSRLNETNDHTAAWSEEGQVLIQRGPDAVVVDVPVEVDGVTGCCDIIVEVPVEAG